ncbi:hypothetical protein B0H16DRAFT_1893828 [Mycena metata]|uniref:Uncharacterized protein n=1 Tax=Mycena metata TaxID=1033252 RepID=A0AAD7HWE7_9AGAR|nr:hypothetical protein B0H16DRAFT_1893828 [Mycena metata]
MSGPQFKNELSRVALGIFVHSAHHCGAANGRARSCVVLPQLMYDLYKAGVQPLVCLSNKPTASYYLNQAHILLLVEFKLEQMFTSSASSSTVSLVASSRPSSQSKDYSAVFASLQSNYGLAGSAPSIYFKRSQSGSKPSKPTPFHAPSAKGPALHAKDYQAAFGALSSRFGFGTGHAATSKYQAA